MKNSIVLGVDVGGSHITSALIDINRGELLPGTEARVALDSTGPAEEILNSWTNLITISLGVSPENTPVGIAMPGPFDYEKGICLIHKQEKFQALYQLNLKELLAERLDVPASSIYFSNDASSFLEGEMLGGALRGQRNVMGITLGTGLGSAFSSDGLAEDADLWQSPFKQGIAEDYLSTRWFTGYYRQITGKEVKGVKELIAQAGASAEGKIIFQEFAQNLALFLSQQYEAHHYSNIVVGGNIAKAAPYFEAEAREFLKQFSPGAGFSFSQLGEKASLFGAAAMAYRRNAGVAGW